MQLPIPDRNRAAFIASDAVVIGDVHICDRVNIWYKVVIRADVNRIDIGYCTNIQDGAILHGDPDQPLVIGEYVTIGHRAVIVGAGAVVTKDVPAGVVVTGVPAKIMRELSEQEQQNAIAHAEGYYQLSLLHV
jgi:carbonic anhydrase/acetyltransferase-like protein (isoleucine patch superfamily)